MPSSTVSGPGSGAPSPRRMVESIDPSMIQHRVRLGHGLTQEAMQHLDDAAEKEEANELRGEHPAPTRRASLSTDQTRELSSIEVACPKGGTRRCVLPPPFFPVGRVRTPACSQSRTPTLCPDRHRRLTLKEILLLKSLLKSGKDRTLDDVALLTRATADVKFFRHLTQQQHRDVCREMTYAVYPADTTLFQQGDEGHTFYIVFRGACKIYTYSADHALATDSDDAAEASNGGDGGGGGGDGRISIADVRRGSVAGVRPPISPFSVEDAGVSMSMALLRADLA